MRIYHNPKCRKSREALNYLNECGYEVEVIKYLDNKLTSKNISDLLKKINLSPEKIVRKNESLWKTKFSKMNLKEDELIGGLIVTKSILAPLRRISQNAGINGAVIIEQVQEQEFEIGYNAATNKFGNMYWIQQLTPLTVAQEIYVEDEVLH